MAMFTWFGCQPQSSSVKCRSLWNKMELFGTLWNLLEHYGTHSCTHAHTHKLIPLMMRTHSAHPCPPHTHTPTCSLTHSDTRYTHVVDVTCTQAHMLACTLINSQTPKLTKTRTLTHPFLHSHAPHALHAQLRMHYLLGGFHATTRVYAGLLHGV